MSLLALAGLLTAIVVPATGAPGDELLPDLVAESVGDADTTATTYTVDGEDRLLLRFTSYIRNEGAGPLEVTGVNPVNERIAGSDLHQVLTHNHDTDGVVGLDKTEVQIPGAELKYEESDGHNHWHFQRAARYSLWNEAKSQELDASQKVGFCFLDIEAGQVNWTPEDTNSFPFPPGPDPQTFSSSTNNCLAHMPTFPTADFPLKTKVDMGITRGWRDVYERHLPFQYIDVSTVAPGHYWLRSEVDPFDLLIESNDNNTAVFAAQKSTVPGYVAKAVDAGQISGVNPATSKITLQANSFRSTAVGTPALGALMFKIVEEPEHGALVTGPKDAQGWFSGANVTLQKDGTYNGPDTFKFAAKQAGPAGQFPLNPASASVTMQVGNGTGDTAVGISGAPAWLYTSAGQQLTADVDPDDGAKPVWRVDNIVGGNSTVGTIDANGFYTSPSEVPANGKVRITATSADGAFDAVEITIVARPVVKPKPDLPDPPVPPVPPAPPVNPTPPATPAPALSKPVIARVGRRLVVKFMPGRTGKLSVKVKRSGKRIASCTVGVVRARGATCRFKLKKSKIRKLRGKISVYGTLKVRGKTVGKRRSTVSLKVNASNAKIGSLCILKPAKR